MNSESLHPKLLMAKMHVMDAAVKVLGSEGIDYIFGIPGANINAFHASLSKTTKIKRLVARQEEGASHAASTSRCQCTSRLAQ